MNVYQKLQEARKKLHAMPLKKSGNNKFAGYQYFELGDFLPQTIEIFHGLGLCDVTSFTNDLATLTVVNSEKPEETIAFTSPMAEAQLKGCHPIQNLGAAETYERRYLWVAAMDIVEHDALDATTGDDKKSNAKPVQAVVKKEGDGPEPDAMILAQFNAAKTVQDLTRVMNGLSQDDKRLYNQIFNSRMNELKKAA